MEGLTVLGRKAQSLACSHGAQQADKLPGNEAVYVHGRPARSSQAVTVPKGQTRCPERRQYKCMEGLPVLGRKAQSLACSQGPQQADKLRGNEADKVQKISIRLNLT
jgi:hypothetical protein